MSLSRAYSLLTVKAVDEDKRVITGIATTPTPDRMGDIVEPKGAEFKLPIPLLWQHRHDQPIGHVTKAKVTKDGIEIEAKITRFDEPGKLKDRLDEAWQSIKSGLVAGLSIGFKPIEEARLGETWNYRFIKWLWLELSAVTIPANGDCSISQVRSIDQKQRAASGHALHRVVRLLPAGVSAPVNTPETPQEGTDMTIAEQIAALEATRAAKAKKMEAVLAKSMAENRSTDQAEQTEFDELDNEVKALDADIERLKKLQAVQAKSARPVDGNVVRTDGTVIRTVEDGAAARGGQTLSGVQLKRPPLAKGVPFVRYVSALVNGGGNRLAAAEYAKRWHQDTPEIEQILRMPADLIEKTAVSAGTTTDSAWAAPLVQYQNLTSEFIEYLRPLTIIGRIQGFRQVPFKIKVPRQTGGASVNWVGETKVKPLTSLAFDSITMDHFKIAGIIPLSEELIRLSSPSAELLVRNDLAGAVVQFMDTDFVDPTKAEAAAVSPASITNGLTPVDATGTTAAAFRTDMTSLFQKFFDADIPITNGVWIMTQMQAMKLSLMRNAIGQKEFPDINVMGGVLEGFPVVCSENIPAVGGSPTDGYPIIFALPNEIMLADDGQVTIDMSREASLQMETSPDSPVSASTVLVSLWQHNLVAIKAERYINWKKRRDNAVQYIRYAKYAA